MLDTSHLDGHLTKVADQRVMVKTEDGATSAVKDALAKELGDNPAILVQDKKDVSEGIAQVINLLLNVLYGLLAMAVIVAVLGVVNTLAMAVFERSQEIGMLRAIGLSEVGGHRLYRRSWTGPVQRDCVRLELGRVVLHPHGDSVLLDHQDPSLSAVQNPV